MSISSAPDSSAASVSRSLTSSDESPLGNAVATDAIFTPVPRSAAFATATRFGYTQTAATRGAPGAGYAALAHSERTRPGESRPSSVVRSMQLIARSMAASLASFLIERFEKPDARASSITASTVGDEAERRRGMASHVREPRTA